MIVVSLLLFVAGIGLLATGLVTASLPMELGSIAAALLSGVALYLGVRQRRPFAGEAAEEDAEVSTEPVWRAADRLREPEQAQEAPSAVATDEEPEEEEVSPADALLVGARTDSVLVVDGRPRYHLAGCPSLSEREIVLFPVSEARAAGFTPCGWCGPDAHLLASGRSA